MSGVIPTVDNTRCVGVNEFFCSVPVAKVIGRFQVLKRFQHPYICQYADIVRGRHDKLYVVSEHYRTSLRAISHSAEVPRVGGFVAESFVRRVAFQTLQALAYLHGHGVVHRALHPSNITVCLSEDTPHVRLAAWGLHHMTAGGTFVTFTIGSPAYTAPEVFMRGVRAVQSEDPKADVWSLGLILVEILTSQLPFSTDNPDATFAEIIKFFAVDGALSQWLSVYAPQLSAEFADFICACLTPEPASRPSAEQVLSHFCFCDSADQSALFQCPPLSHVWVQKPVLRCLGAKSLEQVLEWMDTCAENAASENGTPCPRPHKTLDEMSIQQDWSIDIQRVGQQ